MPLNAGLEDPFWLTEKELTQIKKPAKLASQSIFDALLSGTLGRFEVTEGMLAARRKEQHFSIGSSIIIVLWLLLSATGARAVPLTPFRYPDQAQRHCPNDQIVWLDFRTRRYYLAGQRLYGVGNNGSYVCRSEAKASGFRRSLLGVR